MKLKHRPEFKQFLTADEEKVCKELAQKRETGKINDVQKELIKKRKKQDPLYNYTTQRTILNFKTAQEYLDRMKETEPEIVQFTSPSPTGLVTGGDK